MNIKKRQFLAHWDKLKVAKIAKPTALQQIMVLAQRPVSFGYNNLSVQGYEVSTHVMRDTGRPVVLQSGKRFGCSYPAVARYALQKISANRSKRIKMAISGGRHFGSWLMDQPFFLIAEEARVLLKAQFSWPLDTAGRIISEVLLTIDQAVNSAAPIYKSSFDKANRSIAKMTQVFAAWALRLEVKQSWRLSKAANRAFRC